MGWGVAEEGGEWLGMECGAEGCDNQRVAVREDVGDGDAEEVRADEEEDVGADDSEDVGAGGWQECGEEDDGD
ncbi:MAG: hypothetical protein IJ148_11630 [Bacteroidaceae bacterium]|nr:hypothetical protein [Bacteroidaceae bacterium]MBQ9171450.1 hypothetical protein [Bacteroidaceae bacterium]